MCPLHIVFAFFHSTDAVRLVRLLCKEIKFMKLYLIKVLISFLTTVNLVTVFPQQ